MIITHKERIDGKEWHATIIGNNNEAQCTQVFGNKRIHHYIRLKDNLVIYLLSICYE